jgi:hypothetical protein
MLHRRPIHNSTLFLLSALALSWALLTPSLRESVAAEACWDGITCLDQGWSTDEQAVWYTKSQGSRLLPLAWALALEEPDREGKFLSEENMGALGYLPAPVSDRNPHKLPLGFTADHEASSRADIMCETFPNTCAAGVMRQPWFGMTCSACHTNEINFGDKRIRIDGAPTLADFQGFLEQIVASLKATHADAAKFDRFARAVLGTDLSVQTRTELKAQLAEHIAWQQGLIDRNAPGIRYGYGRLDAQGHILNKVAAVGEGKPLAGALKSNGPASYPFIWNTSQQDRVQWNGISKKILNVPLFDQNTEIGALVRNTSEVIGVFAHIEINSLSLLDRLGHKSSLRVREMIELESQLERLKSPRWPEDVLPAIDWTKAERGRVAFESSCSSCHADLAWDDLLTPIKAEMSPLAKSGTDISLACNTFVHRANSGNYRGRRPFLVVGSRIEPEDFTRSMLTNAAVGAVVGRADELAGSLFDDVFKPAIPPSPAIEAGEEIDYLPGVTDTAQKELAKLCLEAQEAQQPGEDSILAYKARPLNGIWATAPYLHNGSVPTLYDLLLPSPLRLTLPVGEQMRAPGAGDRPTAFHVGSRNYDPMKVGFETQQQEILTRADGEKVKTFEFNVYGPDGNPLPGNYNSGHEYGTGNLTEQERWDLIEYLKTL